jgi:hypothetical protein
MSNFPKKVAVYTASFENIGQSNETLKIQWNYPNSPANPGSRSYIVGIDCFLESPSDTSQVPDEHLIASISMMAILAGARPGTKEFIDAISNQDTAYFQTIIGSVKLKTSTDSVPNPMPVSDINYGPTGTVFDITFLKQGTSTNMKVVRADAWSISDYDNRVDSAVHAVDCIPGAIHKGLGLKKSQLGIVDSANRQAVIAFVAAQLFWV